MLNKLNLENSLNIYSGSMLMMMHSHWTLFLLQEKLFQSKRKQTPQWQQWVCEECPLQTRLLSALLSSAIPCKLCEVWQHTLISDICWCWSWDHMLELWSAVHHPTHANFVLINLIIFLWALYLDIIKSESFKHVLCVFNCQI